MMYGFSSNRAFMVLGRPVVAPQCRNVKTGLATGAGRENDWKKAWTCRGTRKSQDPKGRDKYLGASGVEPRKRRVCPGPSRLRLWDPQSRPLRRRSSSEPIGRLAGQSKLRSTIACAGRSLCVHAPSRVVPSVRAMPSNKWTDEVANLASESDRACVIANQVFVVVTESMFQEDPAADDDDVDL